MKAPVHLLDIPQRAIDAAHQARAVGGDYEDVPGDQVTVLAQPDARLSYPVEPLDASFTRAGRPSRSCVPSFDGATLHVSRDDHDRQEHMEPVSAPHLPRAAAWIKRIQ
jgi:hypothetical protein